MHGGSTTGQGEEGQGDGGGFAAHWSPDDYKWDAFAMAVAEDAAEPACHASGASCAGRRSSTRRAAGSAMKQLVHRDMPRPKRASNSVFCQVPGCGASLADCKAYHKRYKICVPHARASEVELEHGIQRFCQQCGRFHELSEFAGTNHSCRTQLQRHNALRRKGAAGATAASAAAAASAAGAAAGAVSAFTVVVAATVGAGVARRSAVSKRAGQQGDKAGGRAAAAAAQASSASAAAAAPQQQHLASLQLCSDLQRLSPPHTGSQGACGGAGWGSSASETGCRASPRNDASSLVVQTCDSRQLSGTCLLSRSSPVGSDEEQHHGEARALAPGGLVAAGLGPLPSQALELELRHPLWQPPAQPAGVSGGTASSGGHWQAGPAGGLAAVAAAPRAPGSSYMTSSSQAAMPAAVAAPGVAQGWVGHGAAAGSQASAGLEQELADMLAEMARETGSGSSPATLASNGSVLSGGSNSSAAAASAWQQAAPGHGSYGSFTAACQAAPQHQLLSLPVPDEFMDELLTSMGVEAAAAAASAMMPAVQMPCAQAPWRQQQQQQQQRQQHASLPPGGLSGAPLPGASAGSGSGAALPGGASSSSSSSSWVNPLSLPLPVQQRAAAASHVRSVLAVAAAEGSAASAVLQRALTLMESSGDWLPHAALVQLGSLSLKLLGATPAELPHDLREQLLSAVMAGGLPEAFLRPGCSLLTLDFVTTARCEESVGGIHGAVDAAARLPAAADVVTRLCQAAGGWFASQELRVQLGCSAASWQPAVDGSCGGACAPLDLAPPALLLASAPALLQQQCGGAGGGWLAVVVAGVAACDELALSVRSSGCYVAVDEASISVQPCSTADTAGTASWQGCLGRGRRSAPDGSTAYAARGDAAESALVWFRLAEPPPLGLLRIELTSASSGASTTTVALVSCDPQLVEEVNSCGLGGRPAAAAGAPAAEQQAREQQVVTELALVLELKQALLHGYEAATSNRPSGGNDDDADDDDVASSTLGRPGRALCHYTPADVALLAASARRLLVSAVRAGCARVAASVMPVACLGASGADQVLVLLSGAAAQALPGWQGLGLLHLAVASQDAATVAWLLQWGSAVGITWAPHVAAGAGAEALTPLHLAALPGSPYEIADLLTSTSQAAAAAWFGKALAAEAGGAGSSQQAATGGLLVPDAAMRCALSPAALAAATGRELLNAGVASKLPSGSGAGLLAEAAVQAAQAAAQPPGAMVSAHALADDEGAKKPPADAAPGGDGGGADDDEPGPVCHECGLPLSAFGAAWHAHQPPLPQARGMPAPGGAAPTAPALGAKAAALDGVVVDAEAQQQQAAAAGVVVLQGRLLLLLLAAASLTVLLASTLVRLLDGAAR